MSRFLKISLIASVLFLAFGSGVFEMVLEAQAQVGQDIVPPTAIPGYSQSLRTGGGDLTTLIVLITNYVLGFLGLLAITAVIYAGILYVANFGNDEMTAKAKTILIYVSIGILVIILSFAFVNALVGVVDDGSGDGGGFGPGSPGRLPGDGFSSSTVPSPFGVDDQDFIFPLVETLRAIGDLCPHTPIGLYVNGSGCAQNEIIADTDADGVANVIDTDDDNDGIVDESDDDDDGDGVRDEADNCPDTLNFVTFRVKLIEERKLQIDRVSEEEYAEDIRGNSGCAEYQRLSDIDGDGVKDTDDCDRDADGRLDNQECADAYFVAYPPGNVENQNLTQETLIFRGAKVLDVIRDEIDEDDDNDGVNDFGLGLQPDAVELLLRQVANNFAALENFIRITCATLPQTRRVNDYCGYDAQKQPYGKLVRLLDDLSSDLNLTDFGVFNEVYQEFLIIARTFPRVSARISAINNAFDGYLPSDATIGLVINLDAEQVVDPYSDFCPVSNDNYLWFINKTLDFSRGLSGLLDSAINPPDATGVFLRHEFRESGIFNVILLVRSACKYNTVNPGAGELADVDAAIAGIASARISVFPALATLNIVVNGREYTGDIVKVLSEAGVPVEFDLTNSETNRGRFQYLEYNCGNGQGNFRLDGDERNWLVACSYDDLSNRKSVVFEARDEVDIARRVLTLEFKDLVAVLDVEPSTGTTAEIFTFSAANSQKKSGDFNKFIYRVFQKQADGSFGNDDIKDNDESTFQFPSPGEYRVDLEVSVNIGSIPPAEDSVFITIGEQEPIAAFKHSFPENIRPARILLDGSLSFHPDYPGQDVLSYIWEIDGVSLQPSPTFTGPYTYERVNSGDDKRIYYDFQSVGEHELALTVIRGDKSDKAFDTATVETLLGVDFSTDKFGAHIDELITFTPEQTALGYFWDFGDRDTLVADEDPVVHKYNAQGNYTVRLTVEDGSGNTNFIDKKMRVGRKDGPVAVTKVVVSGIEQNLTLADCIEVTRNDNVVFDAGGSVSVSGGTSGISFLWEIEDFEEIFRTRTFTRVFRELSGGTCIDVDLTVTDLTTNAVDEAETISIDVVNIDPSLTDLRYVVSGQNQVTPVTVNISALGVKDDDGRVLRYRWWYYEEGQGNQQLDSRVTDVQRTTFVIGPRNIEGTETTYFFAVEIEDNDGAKVDSRSIVGDSKPLVVTNGPNIAPVAEFVSDRSSVEIGTLVSFSSTTRDPLGEFIPSAAYQWDLDGDGEYERGVSGAKVTHRYSRPGTYKPSLKVTKNGLSSEYSMTIRVLPSTKKPEAAFIYIQEGALVRFISNSTVDPALDNKDLIYAWDFDITIDTDGNGIPDDDADSALFSPSFEFKGDRDVLVGLRVTDNVGNVDKVVRKIPFILRQERGPLGAKKVTKLRAILVTNPPQNELDGRIYLRPPFSDIVLNSARSTGEIQEYRIDINIFIDSDGDGIEDNDIDNKTHKSWKEGTAFKATYQETEDRIRAKLTVVSTSGNEKSKVVDIVFSEEDPVMDLDTLENPDDILTLLENIPVVTFNVSSAFASPDEEIVFDASGTKFPDETVREYRWDFDGDGLVDEISFVPEFAFAFDEAGAYEVILEAESSGGLLGEYSQTIFIRGGLVLPEAGFDYNLEDNQVLFTDTSSFDPSMIEEEILYQWTFRRLDLSEASDWETWEKVDDLVIAEREFNLSPVWVTESLSLESATVANGVVSRELVLGEGDFVLRFQESTTLLGLDNEPFVGELRFVEGAVVKDVVEDVEVEELEEVEDVELEELEEVEDVEGVEDEDIFDEDIAPELGAQIISEELLNAYEESKSEGKIGDEDIILSYDTGLDELLSLSEEVSFIFDGVILNPKLYQDQEDGDPILVATGTLAINQTTFVTRNLAGKYFVTGELEPGAGEDGEFLGISTVKNPIKVFTDAGLYRVTLQVTDGVGEVSESTELITVTGDLQVAPPGVVLGEEELGLEEEDVFVPAPIIPVPEIVSDEEGGFSYFWLFFIIVLIILTGGVVYIVIRTVKQRQAEIGPQAQEGLAPKEEIVKPEVVEPAHVEKGQIPKTKDQGEKAPEEKKPAEVKQAPPAKVEESPDVTVKKEDKGKDEKGDDKKPKGGDDNKSKGDSGPIPDWLKG